MGIQERKEREKERRRQQIIVAAKRVFSEKGFNKATMEDIAKEAELSPGTLYLYFKNKEELYASLSLRILQYLHIRVSHVHKEPDANPVDKLDALMVAMYDVYDFDRKFGRCYLVKSESGNTSKIVLEILKILKNLKIEKV